MDIPINALISAGLTFCVLSFATVYCKWLEQSKPDKDYTELNLRIKSWWWMLAILFIVLFSGKTATIFFFAVISFLALKEFFSIVPVRQTDRRVLFWAYLSIPLQYYWIADEWYGMFIIFIPVYVFLFLPMRMVLIGDTKGFIRASGIIHWGTMLSVFCLSHIAYLIVLPEHNSNSGAIGLILFLIFATQANDVFQYIWGKSFGKHKIIAKVSPNKTWEGFLGAWLTIAILSALTAPLLTPLNAMQGLFAGIIISTAGFIGDVVISSVKRDLSIKDSGQMIPGHGGLLDRLDSLTFTAPLFFHYIYYLHY